MKFIISAESRVLDALRTLVPGASGRTLRQMLGLGRVSVNGVPCTIATHRVRPGDVLEVGRRVHPPPGGGLEVCYEDRDLLVVHKPAGLLTVAAPGERERTATAFLGRYLRARNPSGKAYVVHRLDRFVSGLLVFAKSEQVQRALRRLFEAHEVDRKYWAVVEGRMPRDSGTIRSHLAEGSSKRVSSTTDPERGKLAVTHYRVLRRFADLTVLEVSLETGRKNQIRAHLAEIGHPVVGDRAYGSTADPLGRMGLHAFRLGFEHPVRRERLLFATPPPPEFRPYLPAAEDGEAPRKEIGARAVTIRTAAGSAARRAARSP